MTVLAPSGAVPRDGDDSGFTLIEVMVVVLILGILLSIGVPTFLGARERGADTAARSTLSTAMNSAVLSSDFRSDFALASAASLAAAEPGVVFVAGDEPSTGPNVVSVDASSSQRWVGAVQSDSGSCFAVVLGGGGQTYTEPATCQASAVAVEAPETPEGAGGSSTALTGVPPPASLVASSADASLGGYMTLVDGYAVVTNPHAGNDPPASYADYTFYVAEAGSYKIKGDVSAPDHGADSFYVLVNSQSEPYVWGVAVNKSTDYVNDGNGGGDVAPMLSEGATTVRVYFRETNTKLRSLELVLQ